MPEVEFKVVPVNEVSSSNVPGSHMVCDADDWGHAVCRYEDGELAEVIGTDGGEPEDQTLGRGWAWVAPALKVAYERGRRDGDSYLTI